MKKSFLLLLLINLPSAVFAKDAAPEPVPVANPAAADPEESELEKLKQRYWAQGEEGEIGVVQNRTYSKRGRFEVGLLGGVAMSDPFISTTTAGGQLGLNISEYFAIQALAWKDFVKPSSALLTFEQEREATTNTNKPQLYYGLEGVGSIFYGKLSVLGASIIYYDLFLSASVGMTKTESGTYITPGLGIGQRFYLNKYISVRLDYRGQYYRENVIEKQIVTKLGQSVGQRNVFTNNIQLGIQFMLPGGF